MGSPEELWVFPSRLEAAGLEYMVTGGLAAILYGRLRLTNDVDLVLAISEVEVGRLAEVFGAEEFYCPPREVMRMEVERGVGGHFNIIHTMTSLKADIYPLGQAVFERDAFSRRRRVVYAGGEVWVAPLDYVIARKLEFFREGGSEKHIRDIQVMLAGSGEQLDRERLEEALAALGLTGLWDELFGRKEG